jgi:hypothetical protein
MDEHFSYFLQNFQPIIEQQSVPAATMDRCRGKLPDQLLAYWGEFGWCGYADGLFWTVNPQHYEPALEAWIGNTSFMERDGYHVIARSAFGHLLFWGQKTGYTLRILAPYAMASASEPSFSPEEFELGVKAFFSTQDRPFYDLTDKDDNPLFERARAALGPLQHDEMYGFVPALALGGPATLDHLQKVKAVEHLVLLAQLSELRVLNPPPKVS